MFRKTSVLAVLTFLMCSSVNAGDVQFLTDYSKLADGGDSGFTKMYIAPGGVDRIAHIASVMVDQPEFFIDPESKYKGIKPGDALAVGEELRAAMIEGIGQSLEITEEPGADTALISWAVTNLRLEKKRRGVLGYTPVGAVAYGVKKQLSDVVDKTRAFDVTFEVEASDVDTGEVIFAMVFDMTEAGIEAEWDDALTLANGLGKRIGCRINNSRLAVADRVDCMAIPVAD